MTDTRPYTVPKEPGRWGALALATLVHAALIAFLWIGVHWQSETPATIEAEVWSLDPQEAAPTPQPEPQPEPQPVKIPELAQAPAPEPQPQPEPEPQPQPVVEEPPLVNPDIALEQEKQRKLLEEKKRIEEAQQREREREQERLAKEMEKEKERKRLEEEKLAKQREEAKRIEKEKAEKEKAERERAEKLKAEKEKAEREKAEKEKAERARIEKEKAEKEKAEKLQAEKARKEAAEKKRKQEAADAEMAAKMREEEMRRITGGVTGAGGTGNAPKSQGGRASAEYGSKVGAKIKSNTIYNVPENLSGNPAVEYAVELLPDGTLRGTPRKLRSSGIPGFDEAVLRAIEKSQPFPRDERTGTVPSSVTVSHKPKGQ